MLVAALALSASGLVLSPAMRPAVHPVRTSVSMAAVDEFTISKDIKCVRIFDGDYVRAVSNCPAQHPCPPCRMAPAVEHDALCDHPMCLGGLHHSLPLLPRTGCQH